MTRSSVEGLQYRVRVEFVLRLPSGAEPPTPTREAVDAVALCVAGPPYGVVGDPVVEVVEVAPGSSARRGPTGSGTGAARVRRSGRGSG